MRERHGGAADYRKQYLADVAPWLAALRRAKAKGATLDTALARAAGRQAVAVARKLLRQTWPAAATHDVRVLARQFDIINEDIIVASYAKYENAGIALNADANVVRADLDLPSVR